jgi:hypothetical protein
MIIRHYIGNISELLDALLSQILGQRNIKLFFALGTI